MEASKPTASEIAAALTLKQRADVLSFDPNDGFATPYDGLRIRRMWYGIKLPGIGERVQLLLKAQSGSLYALNPLGREVRAILERDPMR